MSSGMLYADRWIERVRHARSSRHGQMDRTQRAHSGLVHGPRRYGSNVRHDARVRGRGGCAVPARLGDRRCLLEGASAAKGRTLPADSGRSRGCYDRRVHLRGCGNGIWGRSFDWCRLARVDGSYRAVRLCGRDAPVERSERAYRIRLIAGCHHSRPSFFLSSPISPRAVMPNARHYCAACPRPSSEAIRSADQSMNPEIRRSRSSAILPANIAPRIASQ